MPAIRRVLCALVMLGALAACGSDTTPGESVAPSGDGCAQERERLVEDVRFPLQLAANQLKENPDTSYVLDAFGRVGGVLDTVAASECVKESEALHTLLDLVDTRRVTERHMRKADAAFETWARSMGASARIDFPEVLPDQNPCPQMRKEVRASYRVIREPEVGGVRVSLELVLENHGSRVIYLDHGGQVRASHVRPGDQTRTYGWGGSSADTAAARAGRTSSQRVALVPPGPLHLFSTGRVEVFDVYASAYSNVGPCGLNMSRVP